MTLDTHFNLPAAAARALLVLATAALFQAETASADSTTAWTIKGKLLGDEGEDKKAENVSGLACASAVGTRRTCLIVDDESQGAQVVILKDGSGVAGDSIRLIDDRFDGKLLELDAEAVAFSDGYFYVVGSHGRPRHERPGEALRADARARAARHVFCIAIEPRAVSRDGTLAEHPAIRDSVRLYDVIRSLRPLAHLADAPLDDKGLTVEGAAVRAGRFFAGLRAPVSDGGQAYIVSVPLADLFGETRPGQPDCGVSATGAGGVELHKVNLSVDRAGVPRGIRDLVRCGDGFLILAGPERDPPEGRIGRGDYAIYASDLAHTRMVTELDAYGRKVKPEGLLPLGMRNGRLDALLLFDGPKEGRPTPISIDLDAFGTLTPDAACP